MSFQFVNNWPYSSTTFPSMIEHVDPVNNEYFTGLMTELERIEYYLGINPQGSYKDTAERLDNFRSELGINPQEGFNDVKDKLENHGHSGGVDGKQLTIPEPGIWENADFVGTPEDLEIDPGVVGGSYAGFAYYDLIYLGPCERDTGPRYNQCFNTTTEEHTWQPSITAYRPGGALFNGTYGIYSLRRDPGEILRFNPENWAEIVTALPAGCNYPNHICKPDTNIWGGTWTTPARLFRYHPATHAVADWAMEAGENEIHAICTDGTYLWACCNTDPVKLIKFNIAAKTHIAYTLTGLKPEIKYMFYHQNRIYMFSDNAVIQWARFDISIHAIQRWEPDFPYPFRGGANINGKYLLTISDNSNGHIIQFDPDTFEIYISAIIGSAGEMGWITYANEHVVWIKEVHTDKEAAITIII